MGILLIAWEVAVGFLFHRSLPRKLIWHSLVTLVLIAPWVVASMGTKLIQGQDLLPQISWIPRPTFADFVWFYAYCFGTVLHLQLRGLLLLILPGLGLAFQISRKGNLTPSAKFLLSLAVGLPAFAYCESL